MDLISYSSLELNLISSTSHVTFCRDILCYIMLCYAMLCYIMLCYAMLCYAMLCYAVLCQVTFYGILIYVMMCCVVLCVAFFILTQAYFQTSVDRHRYEYHLASTQIHTYPDLSTISCDVMLCYAMLDDAMQCYAML